MDKPYELFLQAEHDSAPALDDFFLDPERPPETAWAFRTDILVPDEARLDEAADEEKTSSVDSLDEVSYLHDISPPKQEATTLRASSSDNFSFDNFNSSPKDQPIDFRHRNVLCPPQTSNNFAYVTGEQSAMSTEDSANESIESVENHQFDQSSEKGNCMGGIDSRFEGSIRAIRNSFLIQSSDIRCTAFHTNSVRKEVQKPPTTAGIGLDNLKAVFDLERPKAEKALGLKRTTFSNLCRHYGILKWPFRTIRDARNRMKANEILLSNRSVSKERRRKIMEQQRLLEKVIYLIYEDPRQSRDSNTLAVLLRIVAARENHSTFSEL